MDDITLHDLLARWEAERSADRDPTQVSPSDLGALCKRQVAFRINGRSATDEVDPVTVATVGSLLHAGTALLWDKEPWTVTEYAFAQGGHADVLRGNGLGLGEVRDLKTISRSKFDAWAINDGPPAGVWLQLAAYAARAIRDMAVAFPVDLLVDALCRESGRTATYRRAYSAEWGEQAEAALTALDQDLRDIDPLDVPTSRTGRGDWLCDSCPFLTACVGEDQRPVVTELEEAEVVHALHAYAVAAQAEKDAAAAKADARARLAHTPEGQYGTFRLKWGEPRDLVDWAAAKEMCGGAFPLKTDEFGEPLVGSKVISVGQA